MVSNGEVHDRVTPDQDDLSLVLKRLMSRGSSTRKRPESRRRLANSPLTREYLEAGLRLLARQFEPMAHDSDEDNDEPQAPSPFFSWLSAQKVIDEVMRGGRLSGNQGTFEDRWPYRDYFIEDLLAYGLWAKNWSARAAIAQEVAESLSAGTDVVQEVYQACDREYREAVASPSAKLWLIANTIAERYPEMKEAMGDVRQAMDSEWVPVCELFLANSGLRLRPDVTPEKLIQIFAALVTGISLRLNTYADDAIDRAQQQSLLGDAVLAVLAGSIDTGDGKSVTELISGLTSAASQV
jgi:hypothetical protein